MFYNSSASLRYGLAVLAAIVALTLRLALDPILGPTQEFLIFPLGILAATRLAGRRPGLVATALSVPLALYFFIVPRYSFAMLNRRDIGSLALLAALGAAISLLGARTAPRAAPPETALHGQFNALFLRRAILLGGTVIVLIALTRLLYSDFERENDRQNRVTQTYELLNGVHVVMSRLEQAAAAQRGYLLTGDSGYLDAFRSALAGEQSALFSLHRLGAADDGWQASLEALDRLVQARAASLQETVATRQRAGAESALLRVRTGNGERLAEQCREALYAFDRQERGLLVARSAAAQAQALRTRWVLGLGSGSLLLLLVIAGAVIERDIQQRERMLRRFTEAAPVAIAMFDRKMRYLAASRRYRDDFHLGSRDLTGQSHYDIFPEIPAHWREIHQRCLAGAVERHPGERFTRPDGSSQWVRWEIQPWRHGDGEIGGIVLFCEEISAQKQSEQALVESEARLRMAQQIARVGAFEWNIRTDTYLWTPELETIYGFAPGEYPGTRQAWESTIHPEDRAHVIRQADSVFETGKFQAEWRIVRPDGSLRWMAGRGLIVHDGAGNPERLIGVNIDISELRAAEASARQWQRAFEQADLAISLSETNSGTLQLVNDSFARQRGYTPSEMTGYPIGSLFPAPLRDAGLASVALADREGHLTFDSEHLRRDGTCFPVRVDLTVVRNGGGEPTSRVAFVRDLTAQRRAEQRILQLNAELEERVRDRTAQLEAANRELEAFAYSVSHDLRAPLRGIDGWSLALAEDYAGQLDSRAQNYLARVRSETQRMGRLIDDMLQLSRVTRAEMELVPVDLSAIARSVAARCAEAAPGRRMQFQIQPDLAARGDAHLLEIALTNLLGNACKFTATREEARIAFGRDDAGAFYIRDNGVGFDMAYAGTLFRPFQRLHKAREFPGTGIGLAIVQRVIHRHGGRLWVHAEPDRGAAFYFTVGGAG